MFPFFLLKKQHNLLKKNHSLHLCRVMGEHICTYISSTWNPLLQFNVLNFLWVQGLALLQGSIKKMKVEYYRFHLKFLLPFFVIIILKRGPKSIIIHAIIIFSVFNFVVICWNRNIEMCPQVYHITCHNTLQLHNTHCSSIQPIFHL